MIYPYYSYIYFDLLTKPSVYKLATYTKPLPVSMIYDKFGSSSSLIVVYLVILITCKSVNVVTSRQTKTILNTS